MMFKKSLVTVGSLGLLAFGMGMGCSSSPNPGTDDGGGDSGNNPGIDSGVRDTGARDRVVADMGSGGMCPTPDDVSNFMPPDLPAPTGKHQAKCDMGQLSTYHDCVNNQNMTACNTIQMAAMTTFKDCLTCLEGSKTTDTKWGPLVCSDPMTCYLNVEGCVDLATNNYGMPKTCGNLLHASYECQRTACETVCMGDNAGFSKCVQTALQGGCKKYGDAFSMTCGMLSSAADAAMGYPDLDNCFRRQSEMDNKGLRTRMDTFFCGP